MTAEIIQFNKATKPKIKATCNFCKKAFEDFKGLQATTSQGEHNICKECSIKCAKLIKESNSIFKKALDD